MFLNPSNKVFLVCFCSILPANPNEEEDKAGREGGGFIMYSHAPLSHKLDL